MNQKREKCKQKNSCRFCPSRNSTNFMMNSRRSAAWSKTSRTPVSPMNHSSKSSALCKSISLNSRCSPKTKRRRKSQPKIWGNFSITKIPDFALSHWFPLRTHQQSQKGGTGTVKELPGGVPGTHRTVQLRRRSDFPRKCTFCLTQILKTWQRIKEQKDFNYPREVVIANHKEKKLIEDRYKNSQKMNDEGDQRQSVKDFITLKVYDAVTQLKNINEEWQILLYKETLEKDPEQKKLHEAEQQKPVPKMKVWEVKKSPQQIHSCMCPPTDLGAKKMDLVAQVWQENANQPTMSLSEVADL